MIDFMARMKLMENLRQRRIDRIEARVRRLTVLLNGLDAAIHPEMYAEVEAERARLWLRRSALVKKLPPVYEGA